jgi:predicted methyltransferase
MRLVPTLMFSFAAFGAALGAVALAVTPAAAHQHGAHKAKADDGTSAAIRAALEGPARTADDRARDASRHPYESLKFWGVKPNMTVVEIRPGAGWWTRILAPYLKSGGGTLIVTTGDPDLMNERQKTATANFLAPFQADPGTFGTLSTGVFAANSTKPLAAPGTVDAIISSRNLHGFALQNIEAYAVKTMFDALKPGGILAIEQHRGDARRPQNPASGYMRQDMVIAQMRRAGFEFVASSEINANPKDTKDHPFGVWTLPPTLQTAPSGQPANTAFDSAPYLAIGESDRMTLLFRKPS